MCTTALLGCLKISRVQLIPFISFYRNMVIKFNSQGRVCSESGGSEKQFRSLLVEICIQLGRAEQG